MTDSHSVSFRHTPLEPPMTDDGIPYRIRHTVMGQPIRQKDQSVI